MLRWAKKYGSCWACATTLWCLGFLVASAEAQEQPKAEPKGESKAVPAAGSSAEPAIGGYCPVSYQTAKEAVKGDPAFKVEFQGLVYFCANADAKKAFEADPAKYVPQFGALCTTALGGSYGNRLPSDATVFYVIDGKLYLFSSLRARNAFDTDPDRYINNAMFLYRRPELQGYCPASYQLANKDVKGTEDLKRIYRGLVYYLATPEAAAAFDKDPARYVPRYDAFCPEGMARDKRYPGDPKVFVVFDGKTYLLFDEAAKKAFEADPKGIVQKADAAWLQFKSQKTKP